MIAIYIDSSKSEEITVRLKKETVTRVLQTKSTNVRGSQVILLSIDKLLKKNKVSLKEVEHIYVHAGPGSYTGLRVGVAIANALSFALHVPVNDKKLGEIVEPVYK